MNTEKMDRNRNIEAIYPLSPMQEGMLFHILHAPDSGTYFRQLGWTIHAAVDTAALRRAWQRVIERHPVLRTAFVWESRERPLQIVKHEVELPWEDYDWRELPWPERQARREEFLLRDRSRPFDLTKVPTLRLTLIRMDETVFEMVWSYPHLLLDGWSRILVLREVLAFYETYTEGRDLELERRRPYRDYIAWLQRQDTGAAESFWRQALAGFRTATPLAVSPHAEQASKTETAPHFEDVQIVVDADTTAQLRLFARRCKVTLNTVIQGAWSLLLSKYSGEDDVVFGATVSGRPADLHGVEAMIGLFINTLPIRVRIAPGRTLSEWLADLQTQQAELRQYEYSSLVDVQGWSEVPRGQLLFESVFVFENYLFDDSAGSADLGARNLPIGELRSSDQTGMPVTISVAPGETVALRAACDLRRFEKLTALRLLEHLKVLLESFVRRPGGCLGSFSPLGGAEIQLLREWTDGYVEPSRQSLAHEVVEQWTEHASDSAALAFGECFITYAEMNERSNRLAHRLREFGVGPEVRVGICLERGPEMLFAILAVLKAGGTYVPLDPAYPEVRLAFILENSLAPLVVTRTELAAALPARAMTICLDDVDLSPGDRPSPNPVSEVRRENLAYIIYTSGSTGLPKGVELHHGGLSELVHAQHHLFGIGQHDHVLQFASLSFDASVWEMFVALTSGAVLVLAEQDSLLPGPSLLRLLREREISMVTLPPSVVAVLPPTDLSALSTLVVAGEACRADLIGRWAPGRRFFNGYGPTEATVCATAARLREDRCKPLIGRPILNCRIHVVDTQLELVPFGVPGELLIGGPRLARGYVGRPELTAERFVPNPFTDEPGDRLYRTGDRVRFLSTGELDFLGRFDHQVKVRGYRIEPVEVEEALRQHPAVKEAAVVGVGDGAGNYRLVAYITSWLQTELDSSELRAFLRSHLPEHMVPTSYVVLPALPLTPAGKVDRHSLPSPESGPAASQATYLAPRTWIEEMLAEIWAQVLRREQVGVDEDFFELGGHSLLGTQLISRVAHAFAVELPLSELFEAPTVSGLAERIERVLGRGHRTSLTLEPVGRGGHLPLSFAQQRLWFLQQLEPESAAYNLSSALRLEGDLDWSALTRALGEVVRRHEALRTTFATVNGEAVQVIASSPSASLPLIDLSGLPSARREAEALQVAAAEASRPFDLARGPLLRPALLRLSLAQHLFLVAIHHIVSDGWSMGIFVRELAALYSSFIRGLPSPLSELTIQYADFACWQRGWLQGDIFVGLLAYWRRQFEEAPSILDLQTDRQRPAVQSFRGGYRRGEISSVLSMALRDLSRRESSTLFMTLLAGFYSLLHRYSGQDDLTLGTPVANRTNLHTEGLIGFFVNTLALRIRLAGDLPFRHLIARVREVAVGAFTHQDFPFEKLVDALNLGRDLSRQPLFQVMFVFQDLPRQGLELSNLRLSPFQLPVEVAKFDLTLSLTPGQEGIAATLNYNSDLFDAPTVDRFLVHFVQILEGVAAYPRTRLSELPLLSEAERHQLALEWSPPSTRGDFLDSVYEAFYLQVERTPDATAVVCQGQHSTYLELRRRAEQLAQQLLRLGVKPGSRVAICCDRSIEMLVGLLGIIRVGGTYVPFDSAQPRERLRYILDDSRAALLLTQSHLSSRLAVLELQTVFLDRAATLFATENQERPSLAVAWEHPAYLIYTSGSTGKPKGILVPHEALVGRALALAELYGLGHGRRLLQFLSLGFDAIGEEIYPVLVSGATLVVDEDPTQCSPAEFLARIEEAGVDTLHIPPAYWYQLLEHFQAMGVLVPDCVRLFITGGESSSTEKVVAWRRSMRHNSRFCNAYGPSEATITATVFEVPADLETMAKLPRLPIGRPVSGGNALVVDRDGNLVPIGMPGELVLRGCLANGYVGRPDLTAEKFMPDPFVTDEVSGGRLYRTGDLARWLPDGNLGFLGRIDNQVQVRGLRVEPGEIEAVLSRYPAVSQAAVIPFGSDKNGYRLAAFVATGERPAPSIQELRQFLLERLPEHMVPAMFSFLPILPLTASGKLDRQALEVSDEGRPEVGSSFVAPRNFVEEVLARIWGEVLNLAKVGVHDNFFELGGDSIRSIQFVSRARQEGLGLRPKDIFEHQTVAGLAAILQPSTRSVRPAPAQSRFLAQPDRIRRSLDRAVLLEPTSELEVAALRAALDDLSARHDALRLRFTEGAESWLQSQAGFHQSLPLLEIDLSSLPRGHLEQAQEAIKVEARRGTDLARGPLMLAALFSFGSGLPCRLLLVANGLLADEVSWRILLEDFATAYEQELACRPQRPRSERALYWRWLEKLVEYSGSADVQHELDYWLGALKESGRSLHAALGVDFLRKAEVTGTARRTSTVVSVERTAAFLDAQRVFHASSEEMLLAAVARTFASRTGLSSMCLARRFTGREALDGFELSDAVGWLSDIHPLWLELPLHDDLPALVQSVKDQLRQVPGNGRGYGVLRYSSTASELLQTIPEPDVGFGFFTERLEWQLRVASHFARVWELDDSIAAMLPCSLEVRGGVRNGCLHVTWIYDTATYRDEIIEELARGSLNALQDLVDYSREAERDISTPSDFPLADLDAGRLERLISKYSRR